MNFIRENWNVFKSHDRGMICACSTFSHFLAERLSEIDDETFKTILSDLTVKISTVFALKSTGKPEIDKVIPFFLIEIFESRN